MTAVRTKWQSEPAPVTVRFWHPAPDQTDKFSCAYVDGGFAAPHVHEEWQFAVAAEPSTITLGAFRRYTVHSNDVTVVAPYDVHTEGGISGIPCRWLVLHVAASVLAGIYGEGTGRAPKFDCPMVRDAASARTLAMLLQSSHEGSIDSFDFPTRVLDWLRHLVRKHAIGAAALPPAGNTATPVERARAYLQAHPSEPLALSDLVDLAGVTASHLVRSFSRTVGLPPKSYHAQIRLARARRLLAEGKPATWVSYECGFADQSHLNRRFKQFYGLTPGAFQAAVLEPSSQKTAGIGFNAA